MIILLLTGLAWGGHFIHKTLTMNKVGQPPQSRTLQLYVDGENAKVTLMQQDTTIYYQAGHVFFCSGQSGKRSCYKKTAGFALAPLQTGLPIEGLAKYTRVEITPLKQSKTIADLPCLQHQIDYELSMDLTKVLRARATGKAVGCFTNSIQVPKADPSQFASLDALQGMKRFMELGYALELMSQLEVHSRLLGKETKESFSHHEITEQMSPWKATTHFFDLPAGYAVIDLTDPAKNIGALLGAGIL